MPSKSISTVECIGVEKRIQPNKHSVYVLQVCWSDGKKDKIHRPYFAFHDFRANLIEALRERTDITIPELPGAKWFERGLLTSKDKKKKSIDEFCQAVLRLPEDVVRSPEVIQFFETWWATDPDYVPPATPPGDDEGSSPPPTTRPRRNPSQISTVSVFAEEVKRRSSAKSSTPPLVNGASGRTHSSRESSGPAPRPRPPPLERLIPVESQDEPATAQIFTAATDYFKQRGDEVNLTKGDVVDVLQKDLSGWWFIYVERTEEQGWAPGSLLEASGEGKETKEDLEQASDSEKTTTGSTFKAILDYEAQTPDEVSYSKGDEVQVLQFSMDGWWKVKVQDRVGFTPATNLQPMTSLLRVKDQNSRVSSGLYHHHSIYRKRQAPPRRAQESGLVTGSAGKAPKAVAPRVQSLAYAEIIFADDKSTGKPQPQIVRGQSRRVEYTEIVLKEPPGSKVKAVVEDDFPQQMAPPPPRTPETAKSGKSPQTKGQNYMNWPCGRQAGSKYENMCLNDLLKEAKQTMRNVCEVIQDHEGSAATRDSFNVTSGDHVEVESEDGGWAHCVLLWRSTAPQGAMHSMPSGWLPLHILKPVVSQDSIISLDAPIPVTSFGDAEAGAGAGAGADSPRQVRCRSSTFPSAQQPKVKVNDSTLTGLARGVAPQHSSADSVSPPSVARSPSSGGRGGGPPRGGGMGARGSSSSSPSPKSPAPSPTAVPAPAPATPAPAPAPAQPTPELYVNITAAHLRESTKNKPRKAKPRPLDVAEKSSSGIPPEPTLQSPRAPAAKKQGPMGEAPSLSGAADPVTVEAQWDCTAPNDGVMAFKKGDRATLISATKKGWWCVSTGSSRGWVPSDYWKVVKTKPELPMRSPPHSGKKAGEGGLPDNPGKKRQPSTSHQEKDWFVGRMSRLDCEQLMEDEGNELDFLVRESTNRVGDFTLSVKFDARIRHFPIKKTADGKFYIGKHNFRSLSQVVHYYQGNQLFYAENGEPVSLGQPLKGSGC